MKTKKEIMDLIEEEDVEFIRLQFTDMFGNLKNVAVTSGQIEKVLDNKFIFDDLFLILFIIYGLSFKNNLSSCWLF